MRPADAASRRPSPPMILFSDGFGKRSLFFLFEENPSFEET